MANKTINDYSSVTPTGTDYFLIQRSNTYYKALYSNVSGGILTKKVTIPTASVLTLNATPYTLVTAPGSGYAIELISATGSIATYGGTAYATNTVLQVITDTATITQASNSTTLITAGTTIDKFSLTAGLGNLIDNKALQAKVATGNPTAGNSDIIIYITYRIITL
jgi:hypothetical protein